MVLYAVIYFVGLGLIALSIYLLGYVEHNREDNI